MKIILKLLAVLFLSLTMTGCVAVLLGGGAAAGGYAVAKDKGPVGQYTDDSVITSKVKARLLAEKDMKSYKISVTTNDGVVTLTGSVPTEDMRMRAITIARDTAEVRAVNVTNFKVKP
ncbi:MAG TPA: BON domain-containing protein [Gammaproteobacteria bacterium]|nr:BON domain-containing protein [Gammaproteobacteria bacterium]